MFAPSNPYYVRQLFTDGMDEDIDPAVLDLVMGQSMTITKLQQITDFNFERGLLITRPPTVKKTLSLGITYLTKTMKAPVFFNNINGNPGGVLVVQDNFGVVRFFSIAFNTQGGNLLSIAQEILGPGVGGTLAGGPLTDASVNGVVLMSGNPTGLVRWDPTGLAYTVIATAPYMFVTKLNSRAIAAYKLTGAATDPITIAASAAGNETDWTSLAAYSNVLSDASDSITGLGVIKGVVTVPRTNGFHLGFPTGIFPNIFNWAAYNQQEGVGCAEPNSFQIYGNLAFFLSEYGVHTFDLVNVEDIGEGVNTEIARRLSDLSRPTVTSFISKAWRQDFRPCYNLFLSFNNGLNPYVQHFMYDITEKKWSRHEYSSILASNGNAVIGFALRAYRPNVTAVNTVGVQLPSIGLLAISGLNANPLTMGYLSGLDGFSLEDTQAGVVDTSKPTFTTGKISFVESNSNAKLNKILLKVYNPAPAGQTVPSVSVTSDLDGVRTTKTLNPINTTYPLTGWNQLWYTGELVGQNFQTVVTLQATQRFPTKFKEMLYEFSPSGEVRS